MKCAGAVIMTLDGGVPVQFELGMLNLTLRARLLVLGCG